MDKQARQQRIRENAAHWYARMQAADCTPAERAAFTRWVNADAAHGEAWRAAEGVANLLGGAAANPRLRAMVDAAVDLGDTGADALADADAPTRHAGTATDAAATAAGPATVAREAADRPMADFAPPAAAGTPAARSVPPLRWIRATALAASLVAAAAAVLLGTTDPRSSVDTIATDDARRRVALADGSLIHVDVGTRIDVAIDDSTRRITLHRGRAVFDVAHDPSRPFLVAAGTGRVRALGTVFEVEHRDDTVVVTLAEGSVEVTGDGSRRRTRLDPGQQIRIPPRNADWNLRAVDTAAVTAWSSGRLVFRAARLADALDEVNRYADRKIRLGDPSLADLTVSGSFMIGDSDAVVGAFAAMLPLRVSSDGLDTLLFRAHDTTPRQDGASESMHGSAGHAATPGT